MENIERKRSLAEQPLGWPAENLLIDWLVIKQPNDGRYRLVNDGAVIRFDADGQVVFESFYSKQLEGSFDTSARLRVTERELELSFNPSRWNRADNVFGYRFEEALEVANRLLAGFDLPPLGGDFYINRADVTLNVACGSRVQLEAYLRSLRNFGLPYRQTRTFEGTVIFKRKNSQIVVYDKAAEMRAHKADGREAVIDWCEEQGIARIEFRMFRRFLVTNNLRHGCSHGKLKEVFCREVLRMPSVAEEDGVSDLTGPELGAFLQWREGYYPKKIYSKNTFYKYRKGIKEKTGYDIGTEPPLRFEQKKRKPFRVVEAQPPDFLKPPQLDLED